MPPVAIKGTNKGDKLLGGMKSKLQGSPWPVCMLARQAAVI
jgi:hypothetical protein